MVGTYEEKLAIAVESSSDGMYVLCMIQPYTKVQDRSYRRC